MGLSNFTQYSLTKHALQRYGERINASLTSVEMHKAVRAGLSRADRVEIRGDGTQVWVNPEDKIAYVVDVSSRKVITVYPSTPREDNELRQALLKSSPAIKKAVERTAIRVVNKSIRDSSQELVTLSERATELYRALSTTKRGDFLRGKLKELEAIEEAIEGIKRERNSLISEANCLLWEE